MSETVGTCALCPRLCRSACPVAVSSAREAAVPAVIAEVLLAWERGGVDDTLATEASTLCVDCGACQAFCYLGQPLPERLREVRARLLPAPAVAPLGRLEGAGLDVAVESDDRAWAEALARRLGRPVGRVRTADGLGSALRGRPAWDARAVALRALLAGRTVWVADGAVARTLAAAGVAFRWLHEVVDVAGRRDGCAAGAARCCGGAAPLVHAHPDDAARMARGFGAGPVADATCRHHLRACGVAARDTVDALLGLGDADAG